MGHGGQRGDHFGVVRDIWFPFEKKEVILHFRLWAGFSGKDAGHYWVDCWFNLEGRIYFLSGVDNLSDENFQSFGSWLGEVLIDVSWVFSRKNPLDWGKHLFVLIGNWRWCWAYWKGNSQWSQILQEERTISPSSDGGVTLMWAHQSIYFTAFICFFGNQHFQYNDHFAYW